MKSKKTLVEIFRNLRSAHCKQEANPLKIEKEKRPFQARVLEKEASHPVVTEKERSVE